MLSDTAVEPPSIFLPGIKGIKGCSRADIARAISRLRGIYIQPQVRGSTRRRGLNEPQLRPTQPNSSRFRNQSLTALRADSFERAFAIQWLTRFISIASESSLDSEDEVLWGVDILEQAASLLAVCSGAAASGIIERVFTFPFTSRVKYVHRTQGPPGVPPLADEETMALDHSNGHIGADSASEIRVMLRDAPLESADFSSVGAQTWGGSCVLAEMISEKPENFGVFGGAISVGPQGAPYRMRSPFRSLELGAGTGLASLVLGKVLERVRSLDYEVLRPEGATGPAQRTELDVVVATDFHPSVFANLEGNVETNFPNNGKDILFPIPREQAEPVTHSLSVPRVVALPLDWSSMHDPSYSSKNPLPLVITPVERDAHSRPVSNITTINMGDTAMLQPLLEMTFDLIIGADIIYEPLHAQWIRSCVEHFLRKPDTRSEGSPSSLAALRYDSALFHLIIPLRRTHSMESHTVEEVFPRASDILLAHEPVDHADYPSTEPRERACDNTDSRPVPQLAIYSQDDILCDAYMETAGAEEVVYRYYKIGWA